MENPSDKEAANISDSEEEINMDTTLYLIPDDLPMAVVRELSKLISSIHGCKNYLNFKAYIQIEFDCKNSTDAARLNGFNYTFNGQPHKTPFAPPNRVTEFVADKFIPNVGVGY